MKKDKVLVVASAGNGFSVACGPWRQIAAAKGAGEQGGSAELGGEVPEELVILPFPEWELEDCTLVTDADSQRMVLEDIRTRQLDLVFDYHHQSVHAAENNIQAIAAGWLPWQSIKADKGGIRATVRWTARASAFLAAGEFRYFSPVVLFEEKTMRVVALLSVALTNTPRTNKQSPLTAALAASIFNSRRVLAASMEGGMKQWIAMLISLLDRTWCHDPKDILEDLGKAKDAFAELMAKDGELAAAAASADFAELPKDATILEAAIAAGLALPDRVRTAIAAAAPIPADVLGVLELPATTGRTELKAHLMNLQTSTVARSEVERLEKELAAARETSAASRVDQLLASYSDRYSPAEEAQLKKFAASDYEATELMLKSRQPIVSAESQAHATPATAPAAESQLNAATPGARRTVVIDGDARMVSADSAAVSDEVNAILAEKGWGREKYAEANELRKERDRLAATK